MVRTTLAFFFSLFAVLATAQPDNHVIVITIDGLPSYMMTDRQAALPSLRKLARDGVLGEGLKVSNPAVTWPNHTTLITGANPRSHSVLFNGVLVRGNAGEPVRVDPKREGKDLVAIPTIFDLLAQHGLRSAAINWPCTRGMDFIEDNFPDVPDQVVRMSARLREELAAEGVLPDTTQKSFAVLSGASRDQIWTEAACHVIRTRKPQYMALHMLITDGTHHKYAAQSQASYTAATLADVQLREVLRALDDAGIREKTTLFIVADHGFETAEKLINPNVILKKHGLLDAVSIGTITKARAQAISEGGIAMVYLTNPQTRAHDREQVRKIFASAEGIAEVITPDKFEELGLPDPDRNPQMADLILTGKPGYAFSNAANGDETITPIVPNVHSLGYHGFISTNPKMNAVFIASGHRIKSGLKVGVVKNIDIAPTAAFLLGQKLPRAEGQVLREILTD